MSEVVLGADACRAGWVVVRLAGGVVVDVDVVAALAPLLSPADPAAPLAIGVDIPIGLTDEPRRDADVAARKHLPGRASSVFAAPPRAVVDAWHEGRLASHAEASALAMAVTGLGLSQQAWRLVPRIAEVDALVGSRRRGMDAEVAVAEGLDAEVAVLEVHPELAFARVAGAPLPRKRSWPGVTTRRALLERLGLVLPDRFPGDNDAAPDDVLDAAICAWVAAAWAPSAVGTHRVTVPSHTAQVDHGTPIVIHARDPS